MNKQIKSYRWADQFVLTFEILKIQYEIAVTF